MASLQTVLAIVQAPKVRKTRGDCQYTREETAVLNAHKAEYRKTTTHAERDILLRTAIFPDIFTHWDVKGTPIEESEVSGRMKVSMDTHIIYLTPTPDYRKSVSGSGTIGGHTGQGIPRRQPGRPLMWTWFGMDGGNRCSPK
jgi:hypothetical protein